MATQEQINELIASAETGEDWAEICRLEAEMLGGPFFHDGSAIHPMDDHVGFANNARE